MGELGAFVRVEALHGGGGFEAGELRGDGVVLAGVGVPGQHDEECVESAQDLRVGVGEGRRDGRPGGADRVPPISELPGNRSMTMMASASTAAFHPDLAGQMGQEQHERDDTGHRDGRSAREFLPGSQLTRLIVGYDCHPASHRAVLAAAELAPSLNASLVLVHVISLTDYPPDPELHDWEAQSEAELEAQISRARWLLADTAVRWEYLTARGDPARAIAQQAQILGALLIVVGAGRGRITSRLLHESVPMQLVRIQRRPSLLYRRPGSSGSSPAL